MNAGKLLKRMLKVGPGLVNILDRRNKQTPLMVGIEYGALEAVKILLEHPACNVNLPSKVGVLCTCKSPMKKISGQAMYGQDAECDACGRKISGKEKRYHCTVPDANDQGDGDEEEEEEEEEENGDEQGDGQENNEEAAGDENGDGDGDGDGDGVEDGVEDGDADGDGNEDGGDGDENGNEEANGDATANQGDEETEEAGDATDDEEDEGDYDDYDSGDDYESEESAEEEKVSKDEHLFDYDMCIKLFLFLKKIHTNITELLYIHLRNDQGAPPLLLAIRRGDLSIFDALLASGRVNFSLVSDDKRSCIYECINCERHDFLAKLLTEYKDKTYPLLNLGDDEKITPAYCAVLNNDVKSLELLMKTGVDLNLGKCHTVNEELDPLLLLACRESYEEIVSLLISSKQCDINESNKQRPEQTCLFYAIKNQSLNIVKLLIANGANTAGLLPQNKTDELVHCLCFLCECKMTKAKIAELEGGEDDEEDDSLDCDFCRKRINTEKNKDGWMYHCTTDKHKYAYYACVSCAESKSVVQPAFVQKLKEAKII
ncbi:hypothetical protein RFI_38579 [Reticulomyxa filosa]|uniref:Uncharacterized protein n=1 Tax=Reticulomyxa filosa TaxID=46433 RepID=X6LCU5_RETFI|nr:hypothetical protein RFI_38579 [Reticulomyxa filosa]|eukprot:ETN98906.1 hypothetical protein RFI_38579 [Reticulomyxa filosa]